MRFRNKRGSLHLGMRVERGAALIAQILANTNRDPKLRPEAYSIYDFMPHEQDDREITLEEAMRQWS